MIFMTPQEAAKKWEVSVRRVQFLCTNNLIPGIQFVNHRWLIPVNAEYPKNNKKNDKYLAQKDNYHFPLFIYSDYYSTRRELNDVENQILQAQLLMARGQHMECLQFCHKLEKAEMTLSEKFGLYCTIVHTSLPLGLYHNIVHYMNQMERICAKDSAHAADYKLIIAICQFQYTYKTSMLKDIHVSELSPQALVSYECFSMQASVYSNSVQSEMSLRLCDSLCRNLEISGNLPTAFIAHSLLALFYGRAGKSEKQKEHIDTACRIGCELKLYGLLTKYTSLNPELYRASISRYDPDFSGKLAHRRQDNQLKWRIVYNAARESQIFPDCTAEDADFLMVLTYASSKKAIAEILNIPIEEVFSTIERLCAQYGLQTKKELVAYARKIFSALTD